MYPAAQEKVIEFMYDTAQKYQLQYFFTTHSMTVVNFLKLGKYNNRNSITYLQKVGDNINVYINPSLRDIENNLNVAAGRREHPHKIKVYCEDERTIKFAKSFLTKEIKERIEFVGNMDLSWTTYKTLFNHKVPEFLNNIILLDGDVRKPDVGWKNYPQNSNIVLLPSDKAPERMIYDMLYEKDEEDPFWDNSLSGYSKDVCFKDYPNYLEDINEIKNWFDSQSDYYGKGYSKFLKEWKSLHCEELESFRNQFISAYNYVAKRTGFDTI